MQEFHIDSWSEFKASLTAYASKERRLRDNFICRGQADSDWPLITTLDREYSSYDSSTKNKIYHQLLKDFHSECLGIGHVSEKDELLARHHGVPTTLLDWTRSPYVAAYFAFEHADRDCKSGNVAIWLFKLLAQKDIQADIDIRDSSSLIADNIRAIEQRALFMSFEPGTDIIGTLSPGLRKITIPLSQRDVALADLDEMLINRRTLFRDRDAAAITAIMRSSIKGGVL